MKRPNNTIEELRAEFAAVRKTAIVGHVRPDGDCISSCLALYHYLKENYGYEADVYLEPYPAVFGMLPGIDAVQTQAKLQVYDVVYSLDCADEGRIGAGRELFFSAKKRVMIDHHISNPVFGDVNYVKGEIGSACEVLYTLFEEEKISYNVAVCLYTGMVHDTGVFQYSNVTPDTLRRAAKLLEFGIPFADLIQKTFYEKGFAQAKASAYAVSKTQRLLDGLLVWTFMTQEEMERFDVTSAELDSVVSELRNIRGADIAAFLYELEPGVFKCSLRSNHRTDVSAVALSFGGGGHVRAAGCTFYNKKPDEIIDEIVNRLSKEDYAG